MPRRADLPNIQPARLDLTNYRGDSLSAKLRLQSQGVPVNVSEWTFLAYIRTAPDGEYIARFSVLDDPAHGADPVNGIIRLWLPFRVAEMLPASCVWDLQATDYETITIPPLDPNDPPTTVENPLWVRTLLRGYIYSSADVTWDAPFIDEQVR